MASRRRTPASPPATDSVLRDIIESPEYRDALKARLLAGRASASEIALARDLGVITEVSIKTQEDAEREAMRRMPVDRRRLMTETLREYKALLAEVLAGAAVAPSPAPRPAAVDRDLTDADLLP